jgi:ankyrin repeat protein
MDMNDLSKLPRKQLQNLAKKHGIKANLSTKSMIEELTGALNKEESKGGEKRSHESVVSATENVEPVENDSSLFELPLYWGSILEGASNPGAIFDAAYCPLDKPRYVSIAMIAEPYVTQLCRRGSATNVSRDAVSEMKKMVVTLIQKCVASLHATKDKNPQPKKKSKGVKGQKGSTFGAEDVQAACQAFGLRFMGANAITAASASYVDYITEVNSKKNGQGQEWNMFSTALCHSEPLQSVERVYSLLVVKQLADTHRASPVASTSIIGKACTTLDSYVFRYVMSFLLPNKMKTKYSRIRRLFNDEVDISDNWDSDVCHCSLAEALSENVDVLKAKDDHTGVSLLHYLAILNQAADCQELITLGVDVNDSCGSMFENGDGWGEPEYLSFTPLNFAASNGQADAAKVLLRNGATMQRAGWDGGGHIPLCMSGADYWYTSRNLPLHQAARGNHANIIHLLLDGPDDESVQYANSKGIDLSGWTVIDVDDSGPKVTLCDSNDNEVEFATTPLAMALLFGNVDAAVALLQHGASMSNVAPSDIQARKMIVKAIFKKNGKMANFLKESIAVNQFEGFDTLLNMSSDSDNEDDEEEEPWEKDEWDMKQVIWI